jgi:hypothetical protein
MFVSKSFLRNLTTVAIVVLGAVSVRAQALIPTAANVHAVAEVASPNPLPDAPEPAVSSAPIVELRPEALRPERPARTLSSRALGIFAYPGYGMLDQRNNDLEQIEGAALVAERASSVFDGASTYIMLDTPFLPDAMQATEADPMLTLFGNRNKVGVLASGAALELAFNGASVAIPHILDRTLGKNVGDPARVGTIFAAAILTVVHIHLAIYNLQNTAKLMQSVKAVNGK